MLSDEVINKVIERIANRIEQGNEYILQTIGSNLKEIRDIIPSQSQQLAQIIRYGGDYDKIVKRLSEITKLNVKDIYKIFDEVAKNDYVFAKQFYKYRNMKYIPYEKNTMLREQVKKLAKITSKEYIEMTRKNIIGFMGKNKRGKWAFKNLKKSYNDLLEQAFINIGQGKESFDSAMYRAIHDMGYGGLRVKYESGTVRRLDSVIRMHLSHNLTQLHEEVQRTIGKDFKSDGVEVTVHAYPAPDHAEVQGHQFYLKEFEKFQTDRDCKDVNNVLFPAEFDGKDRRSIGQYNCYHYTFDIVVGVSKPNYTPSQLQKIINDNKKGFTFEDKHYTLYEGTQLQRRIETAIRSWKDEQILAKASDNERGIMRSQEKIEQLTRKYMELSEASGIPIKLDRLKVNGYRQVKI